jgi:hypothetical protein
VKREREQAERIAEEARAQTERTLYLNDPTAFAKAAFFKAPGSDEPQMVWEAQEKIFASVATHTKTAVRSGHKTSKSRSIGILAWWWFWTRPRARVFCTSSVDRQVRDIIWHEIKALWRLRRPGFDFPKPAELPAIGVRADDGRQILGFTSQSAEGAAGFSSDELLYLIDEASGIHRTLFDAFDGNLASGGRMALFSNATQPDGYFYDAFHKDRAEFNTIRIASTDTPNAREGRIVIPGLATREWCETRKRVWGENSSRYQVRVLGNFPEQGDDSVVPRALVQAAMQIEGEATGALLCAVDVARFGNDEKVIGFRRGLRIEPLIVVENHGENEGRGVDTHQLAQRVLFECTERRTVQERVEVRIDATGVGGGTADALRSFGVHWLNVVDVVNSEEASSDSAKDGIKYANRRAELWFSVKPYLEAGGSLPNDDEADLELGSPKYKFDRKNRLLVESKKEIRARLGRSPDRADVITMLTWEAPSGTDAGRVAVGGRRRW